MAFKLLKDYFDIATEHALLLDSLTFKVGDVVFASGAAGVTYLSNHSTGTAGDYYVLGVLIGFCKPDGSVISQGADPANTPNQLITAANNTTVILYHGVYLPIHEMQEWDGLLSANAGTTTYSDKQNVWFNLSDCRTINEASVLVANDGGAPLQVFSMGTIPTTSSTTTTHVRIKFAKAKLTQP
jgi:hypothetical protein